MHADLNSLRKLIRPATEADARASITEYEASEQVSPSFVFALESEMREDFLSCAHRVTRDQALEQANQQQVSA